MRVSTIYTNHFLSTSKLGSSHPIIMGSNPGTPVFPGNPECPTTPINTDGHTLYHFGDKSWSHAQLYHSLAAEMSLYFVGPMPAVTFLSKFLPCLSSKLYHHSGLKCSNLLFQKWTSLTCITHLCIYR